MEEIKKEELDKLLRLEGEVRGAVFQTDAKNVLEKEGEEGLKKLEERVKSLGYNINYRSGKAIDWHPVGLRIISLIVKFVFKLFAPLKKLIKEIPRDWREHYTIGEMEVPKFDEENKELVMRLKDFQPHPLYCLYLEGYIERVLLFVEKRVETRETKCPFRGDPYHEYTSHWK